MADHSLPSGLFLEAEACHCFICRESLGEWVACWKSVALPCPAWQLVQPNFSDGWALLASTKRSSRGWAQYIDTCPPVSLTVRTMVGRSPRLKPSDSPAFWRDSSILRAVLILRDGRIEASRSR